MMQPVAQPINIIIGEEIAKRGPWAVGGQKENFQLINGWADKKC